jgi:hypothetical protein
MKIKFNIYLFVSALLFLLLTGCGTSQTKAQNPIDTKSETNNSNTNNSTLPPSNDTNSSENDKNITMTPLSNAILHTNITATLFWVGESESEDNHQITNAESAWDDNWQTHYGGVDTPVRTTLFPDFKPNENPFYFALPYSDFDDNGNRRENAVDIIPWGKEKAWTDEESIVKNRWIKIIDQNKTVYAQWEDAGPFEYDDTGYVFGTATPKNTENDHAGLDLSPAVWIYLGYDTQNMDNKAKMSWQFVPEEEVPNGPWREVVTYSQIRWE